MCTVVAAPSSSRASTSFSARTTSRRRRPVLVITDGCCDVLRVRTEHAYLVPEGASLPFTPQGPVFRLR
ncbi:hypothetical protein AMK22_31660 [Streptomyces sp. CB01580]|nr:hypothetical protein AMK22_31660 [Streptomyces sp. CB01580]